MLPLYGSFELSPEWRVAHGNHYRIFARWYVDVNAITRAILLYDDDVYALLMTNRASNHLAVQQENA